MYDSENDRMIRKMERPRRPLKRAARYRRDGVDRRSQRDCPLNTHTSPNGLIFDVYCGIDIPFNDIVQGTAETIEDCMDQCSQYNGERCPEVVYEPDSRACWLKNWDTPVDPDESVEHPGLQVAIAHADQFIGFPTDCPYTNGSIQSTPNGPSYEIRCAVDLPGFDTACEDCPWHAESLDECMALCKTANPLCAAVSYNPDMQGGFANCYPKTMIDEPSLMLNVYVTHMAVAQLPPKVKYSCNDDAKIIASTGKSFTVSCDTDRPFNDMAKFHDMDLNSCVERCATHNGSAPCVAVVHDINLENGWENCYLKSTAGIPNPHAGLSAVVLSSLRNIGPDDFGSSSIPLPSISTSFSAGAVTTASSTSTARPINPTAASESTTSSAFPLHSTDSSDSPSNAWIAGPVIGALALLALLAGALIWWRRRNRRHRTRFTPGPAAMGGPVRIGSSGHAYHISHPQASLLAAPSREPPSMRKYDRGYFHHPSLDPLDPHQPGSAYTTLPPPPPSAGPLSGNSVTGGGGFGGGGSVGEMAAPPRFDWKLQPPPSELSAGPPHFEAHELEASGAHELDGTAKYN